MLPHCFCFEWAELRQVRDNIIANDQPHWMIYLPEFMK